ncbi:MAG: 6-bladed beta-propeller [Bacteroidales bacterium]|nr:6-bladed beta-propeller [Bacteroidales bacterium]
MKNLASIVLIVLLCSCGRSKNLTPVDEVIRIDLLSEADMTLSDISEIASGIEYIPLQTTDSSLIGRIDKVVITEDNIYVNNRGSEIICFNKIGNFISKLSKRGRGPGEYASIWDFDISSDSKKLILLSNGKILLYNIVGNEFIFSKSVDLYEGVLRTSFIPGTDNILLSNGPWFGNETSLNLVVNLDGDTLLLKPNCYKYEKSGAGFRAINDAIQYRLGDKICFKEGFSDTIFYVNSKSDRHSPHLILDSHGTVPPPIVRGDMEYAKAHAGEFSSVAIAYEVPRYIFYYYMYKSTRHKILYDKVSNKKYELALENAIADDLNGGPNIDLNMQNCTGAYFYSSVDAFIFKKHIQSDAYTNAAVKEQKKKVELKGIADLIKETDNPLLIIVTPKD